MKDKKRDCPDCYEWVSQEFKKRDLALQHAALVITALEGVIHMNEMVFASSFSNGRPTAPWWFKDVKKGLTCAGR